MAKQQTLMILCEGYTEIEYLKYLKDQNYYSINFELSHLHDNKPSVQRGVGRQLEKIEQNQFSILDDREGEPWQNIKKYSNQEEIKQVTQEAIKQIEEKVILSSPTFEFFLLHYFNDYQDQTLNASITKANVEEELNKYINPYHKRQKLTKQTLPRNNHNAMLDRIEHYRNNQNNQNYTQMYKLFNFLDKYKVNFNNIP